MMDNNQYQETQDAMLEAAKIVDELSISDFILRIKEAESTVPLFFPSEYQAGLNELAAVSALASACLKIKSTLEEYPHLRKLIRIRLMANGKVNVIPIGSTTSNDVPLSESI
jgi:hypothetical protein